ncbi:MAG: BlaB/IND/MUS family subclass B1 metallo-beta-lactamase [Bacteroidetes bacterium]|nr:BlaB/IND/MUS family subclass B1 metallo-beta-lactamase [Bacteroidota bacterium]
MRLFLFILSICLCLTSPAQKLIISPLCKDVYVYTTFGDPGDGDRYPANGLYMVSNKGVVLFDTPWDTTQFQPLLDSIQARHHQPVVMCIATHFHADRTAGLTYYKQHHIKTYTTKQTDELSKQKNEPRAEFLIYKDTTFTIGQYSFETFYPGKGHSPDNIVIWCANQKILYGGCFIKSTETNSPGNLSDANTKEWVQSLKKVRARFGKPHFIIPGHQDWSSNESLNHTLNIVQDYNKQTHD